MGRRARIPASERCAVTFRSAECCDFQVTQSLRTILLSLQFGKLHRRPFFCRDQNWAAPPPSPPFSFFSEDNDYVHSIYNKNKPKKHKTTPQNVWIPFVPDDCCAPELGKPFGVCVRGCRMNFITATKQIFSSGSEWRADERGTSWALRCKSVPHDSTIPSSGLTSRPRSATSDNAGDKSLSWMIREGW